MKFSKYFLFCSFIGIVLPNCCHAAFSPEDEQIAEMRKKITALEEKLKASQSDLATVKEEQKAVKEDVATSKTDLEGLKKTVESQNAEEEEGLDEEALNQKITEITEKKVSEKVAEHIEPLNEKLTVLEEKQEQLGTSLAENENSAEQPEEDAANAQKIQELSEEVQTLKASLQNQQELTSKHNTELAKVSTNVDNLLNDQKSQNSSETKEAVASVTGSLIKGGLGLLANVLTKDSRQKVSVSDVESAVRNGEPIPGEENMSPEELQQIQEIKADVAAGKPSEEIQAKLDAVNEVAEEEAKIEKENAAPTFFGVNAAFKSDEILIFIRNLVRSGNPLESSWDDISKLLGGELTEIDKEVVQTFYQIITLKPDINFNELRSCVKLFYVGTPRKVVPQQDLTTTSSDSVQNPLNTAFLASLEGAVDSQTVPSILEDNVDFNIPDVVPTSTSSQTSLDISDQTLPTASGSVEIPGQDSIAQEAANSVVSGHPAPANVSGTIAAAGQASATAGHSQAPTPTTPGAGEVPGQDPIAQETAASVVQGQQAPTNASGTIAAAGQASATGYSQAAPTPTASGTGEVSGQDPIAQEAVNSVVPGQPAPANASGAPAAVGQASATGHSQTAPTPTAPGTAEAKGQNPIALDGAASVVSGHPAPANASGTIAAAGQASATGHSQAPTPTAPGTAEGSVVSGQSAPANASGTPVAAGQASATGHSQAAPTPTASGTAEAKGQDPIAQEAAASVVPGQPAPANASGTTAAGQTSATGHSQAPALTPTAPGTAEAQDGTASVVPGQSASANASGTTAAGQSSATGHSQAAPTPTAPGQVFEFNRKLQDPQSGEIYSVSIEKVRTMKEFQEAAKRKFLPLLNKK